MGGSHLMACTLIVCAVGIYYYPKYMQKWLRNISGYHIWPLKDNNYYMLYNKLSNNFGSNRKLVDKLDSRYWVLKDIRCPYYLFHLRLQIEFI